MFIIAFMGAGLLFPSYFLQVRGETTLHAGLLMAPQGIGAMLTMPIAGMLADKIPVGRTVPFAMALIAAGFFAFTQVGTDTSYVLLCGSLFVMGLGMGGTMMPIMTSALQTLSHARRGPRLHAGQHPPADRRLDRRRGHVGDPDQPAQRVGPIPGLVNAHRRAGHRGRRWRSPRQHGDQQMPVEPSLIERGPGLRGRLVRHDVLGRLRAWCCATFIPIAFLPRKKEAAPIGDAAVAAASPVIAH